MLLVVGTATYRKILVPTTPSVSLYRNSKIERVFSSHLVVEHVSRMLLEGTRLAAMNCFALSLFLALMEVLKGNYSLE